MENEIKHNCNKCVNGYFAGSDSSGWHNLCGLCGAGHCYLCHMSRGGECSDYKEGEPPKGKEAM